jgi:hypothetical protein
MTNKQLTTLIVTTLFGAGGIVGTVYTLKADTKNMKEDVVKLEAKMENTTEEINENEKIDIRQSVLLEQVTETLKALNKKIDKELEDSE